jgi:hypothetical protein
LELIHPHHQLLAFLVKPLLMSKKAEIALENIRQCIMQSGLKGEALQGALANYPKSAPNNLPAAFMLGASYSCDGMQAEGVQTLEELRKTAIAAHLPSRCLDLTRGLVMRRMFDLAILLLEAAVESQVVSDEVKAILTSIRNIKTNAT